MRETGGGVTVIIARNKMDAVTRMMLIRCMLVASPHSFISFCIFLPCSIIIIIIGDDANEWNAVDWLIVVSVGRSRAQERRGNFVLVVVKAVAAAAVVVVVPVEFVIIMPRFTVEE
eukprot:GHVU01122638.1.p3 GENE.GHVU01122638.1~~GHVU01122638.1.p3  ORF type:complete len:116 (-),score=23.89 GHVU01122638.1:225-572(-)